VDLMTITQQALAALQPPPGAPASAWATRISACWHASLKAILEVGRLLAEAKEALPHGAFGRMIESDLPFTARTAQMLMAISADPRITNPKHISHLPASWGTLYEITKLDDKQFEEKIADGTIRPDMMRRELAPEPEPQTAVPPSAPNIPTNSRVVAPTRVEPKDSHDYAPTPPWATRALVEVVLPQIGIVSLGQVWEPACGEGHIAEVLTEYSDDVIAGDLIDRGYGLSDRDFLSERLEAETDLIITNPPFNKAEEFTLQALRFARVGVAMFVRWQWIEGVGRFERLFSVYPPALVCPFAERVPLHMGRWEPDGDTMTAYCWVVWKRSPAPVQTHTRLFWIPPGQRKALTKPDDAERFTAHPVIKARSNLADDGSPTDQETGEILGEAAE
jgi:hypothetical protein